MRRFNVIIPLHSTDKRDELITSSEIIPSVILLTSRAKNSDAIETTTKGIKNMARNISNEMPLCI